MMAVLLFWQTRLLQNALWVCWLVAFWPRTRGGFVVLADQIAAECFVGLLEVAKIGGNMLAMVP